MTILETILEHTLRNSHSNVYLRHTRWPWLKYFAIIIRIGHIRLEILWNQFHVSSNLFVLVLKRRFLCCNVFQISVLDKVNSDKFLIESYTVLCSSDLILYGPLPCPHLFVSHPPSCGLCVFQNIMNIVLDRVGRPSRDDLDLHWKQRSH